MFRKIVPLLFAMAAIGSVPMSASAMTCGGSNPDNCCGDNVPLGGGAYGRVDCGCGMEVLSSYTMNADMTCSGDTVALKFKTSNVTFNGNGFWIRGGGNYTTSRKAAIDVWGTDTNGQPITGIVIKNVKIDASNGNGTLFPGHWRTCIEVDAAGTTIGDTSVSSLPADGAESVQLYNCGRVVDLSNPRDDIYKDEFYVNETIVQADYNGDGDMLDTNVLADEAIGYGIDARAPNITVQGIRMQNIGDEGIHFVSGQNPATNAANNGKVMYSRFLNVTHEAIYYLMNGSTTTSPEYGSMIKGNLVTLLAGAYQDSETKAVYLKHAHDIWVEANQFVYNGVHILGNSHHHYFKNNTYTYGARIKLSDYKCKDMVYHANWDGLGNNWRGSKSGECCGWAGGNVTIGTQSIYFPAQPVHCTYRQFPRNNIFEGENVNGTFQTPGTNKDGTPDYATDYCAEVRDAENTDFINVTMKNCDDHLISGSSYYHFNMPQGTATYTPFSGDPNPVPSNLATGGITIPPTTTTTDIADGSFDKMVGQGGDDADLSLASTEVEIENASYYTVQRSGSQTLDVVADAYIRSASTVQSKNFGGTTVNWDDASSTAQFISLLKFQRPALPDGATVTSQSATLRMKNAAANSYVTRIFATNAAANGWVEGTGGSTGGTTGVMWSNYMLPSSNIVGSTEVATMPTGANGAVMTSTTIPSSGLNFDADNFVTLALQGPATGQTTKYSSKEATGGAANVQLNYSYVTSVTWGGTIGCIKPSSGTFTCVSTDDAHVREDSANAYVGQYDMAGDDFTLKVSSSSSDELRRAYVKFDLSGIPANTTVANAKVRLHKYSGSLGSNNPMIYALSSRTADDTWTEWGLDADANGNPDGQDDNDHATNGEVVACESGNGARNGYQNYNGCCLAQPCTPSVGPSVDGITWKNAPAMAANSLGTAAPNGSWWELDITSEVNAELASATGNRTLTLVLVYTGAGTLVTQFDSRNGAVDSWPQLQIQ